MAHKIRMPKIDANVEEASVGSWLKEEGEWIEEGDKLAEVITDKANFELESNSSGYLREKLTPPKSVVPVGYVIGLLSESQEEDLPDVSDENHRIMERHREQMLFGTIPGDSEAGEPEGHEEPVGRKVRATPAARRLARQEGVNIEDMPRSPEGVVREEDVENYLSENGG